jgi:hypothetical protein
MAVYAISGGAKYFTSWVLLGFFPPTHPPKKGKFKGSL